MNVQKEYVRSHLWDDGIKMGACEYVISSNIDDDLSTIYRK